MEKSAPPIGLPSSSSRHPPSAIRWSHGPLLVAASIGWHLLRPSRPRPNGAWRAALGHGRAGAQPCGDHRRRPDAAQSACWGRTHAPAAGGRGARRDRHHHRRRSRPRGDARRCSTCWTPTASAPPSSASPSGWRAHPDAGARDRRARPQHPEPHRAPLATTSLLGPRGFDGEIDAGPATCCSQVTGQRPTCFRAPAGLAQHCSSRPCCSEWTCTLVSWTRRGYDTRERRPRRRAGAPRRKA